MSFYKRLTTNLCIEGVESDLPPNVKSRSPVKILYLYLTNNWSDMEVRLRASRRGVVERGRGEIAIS